MTDQSFKKTELEAFLERLAEAVPTPGGGSAATLSGATAAALLEMVAGVSQRRKGAPRDRLQVLCASAQRIRTQLTESMEEDANAYNGVDKALRHPKDTEEQADRRRELLEQALKQAAQVPLNTADKALQLLKLADELYPLIGKQLTSDLSCAGHLALTCVRGALDNVDVNAFSIRDESFRHELRKERIRIQEEAESQAKSLLLEVERALSAWL
ncbi:MAG: cyclodeaminase/cyclohydrolase family protein [Candidatus Bipolaricaulota bacterium]